MNILYIGDIMGETGIKVVETVLPELLKQEAIDLVVAQAENVSEGRGITVADYRRLQKAGIHFFTGGNWSLYRQEILPMLADPNEPIIRPANYPAGTPGLGQKQLQLNGKTALGISLLGKVVGKDADKPVDNPLLAIDKILGSLDKKPDAIVVNFHGDFSSEKVIIGHYLDGRVTAVIGDHWHVPTADARILPKGTAHITDVGMCGVLNASLGVTLSSVLPRWRDGQVTRNVLETAGPLQFNAVLVKANSQGLADDIRLIQRTY
jgi:metallophosphoesterase (TIGR00282 family)